MILKVLSECDTATRAYSCLNVDHIFFIVYVAVLIVIAHVIGFKYLAFGGYLSVGGVI